VGELLDAITEARDDDRISTEQEALDLARELLADMDE
jgi:hypothetical protein